MCCGMPTEIVEPSTCIGCVDIVIAHCNEKDLVGSITSNVTQRDAVFISEIFRKSQRMLYMNFPKPSLYANGLKHANKENSWVKVKRTFFCCSIIKITSNELNEPRTDSNDFYLHFYLQLFKLQTNNSNNSHRRFEIESFS